MSLRYGGRHPKERMGLALEEEDFYEMMAMARVEDRALEKAIADAKRGR